MFENLWQDLQEIARTKRQQGSIPSCRIGIHTEHRLAVDTAVICQGRNQARHAVAFPLGATQPHREPATRQARSGSGGAVSISRSLCWR